MQCAEASAEKAMIMREMDQLVPKGWSHTIKCVTLVCWKRFTVTHCQGPPDYGFISSSSGAL